MDKTDEGFARNLRMLFDDGTFHGIGERKLKEVTFNDENDEFALVFEDGQARFSVEGDCCSHSWIEHVEKPDDVAGRIIVGVSDERIDTVEDNEYECLQVYNTKFILDNGETITLEYRNESNGYYGGYVVRLPD